VKILFLYADDTYFWRNRLGLAAEARQQGLETVLMAPVSDYRAEIEKEDVRVIPWGLSRRNLNPAREFRPFLEVIRVYRRERPDIVQSETLKAILHGGLAARLTGHVPSVNVLCGLGAIFVRLDLKTKLIRWLLLRLLSAIFSGSNTRVVFQNDCDRDLLVGMKVVAREQTYVTPGNGVKVERFVPVPEPEGTPVVLLPGRMLWEKGVGDFVATAEALRKAGVHARFVLVGAPDADNPGCIPESQLRNWHESGVVEWWGSQADMPSIYARSALVCLPSYYGEGLPNVLAEAGASGRAVVACDIPGCRQAVRHGENGLLVPPRDPEALGEAIRLVLADSDLRRRLGASGRQRAVEEFSHARIVNQILGIYRELLGNKWPTREKAVERCQLESEHLVPS